MIPLPSVRHPCQAGATTINIPDTTGWNLPHEFGSVIAAIKKNTPGAENIIISTHCQVRQHLCVHACLCKDDECFFMLNG